MCTTLIQNNIKNKKNCVKSYFSLYFENFQISSKTEGCSSCETIEKDVKNNKNAQNRILVRVLRILIFFKNTRNIRILFGMSLTPTKHNISRSQVIKYYE